MGEWWLVIKVFGGAISAIAVWIVGTKVFEAIAPKLLERYYQRRDARAALHNSNYAADVDMDKTAFQAFRERLEKLEEKFETLQEKYNSLMVENATHKSENQHLKETNERQEKEIKDLRENRRLLEDRVQSLTNLVVELREKIQALERDKKVNDA